MARRRLLIDVSPLRESPQFRLLYSGQFVSFIGNQLTLVAVPYQVFRLTGSSLMVGLVSLAQIGPLLAGSLVGGTVADSVDRRRLLLWMQVGLALTSVGLALNAALGERAALWPVVAMSALAAGLSGFERPARAALVPSLVAPASLPAAYALWQVLLQVGMVAGPALGGLLLGAFGLTTVYVVDVATFAVAFVAVIRLRSVPLAGPPAKLGIAAVAEGLRFIRRERVVAGTFVVDLGAMVFGMPRALFPEIATRIYGGGPATVGLLFAAPGAGALVAALLTGWVGRVRRQGVAVLVAVTVWGLGIAAFGIVPWLPAGLAFLAVAGAADMVSAVFRNTMLQSATPDELRGRLSAAHIAVVTGGPRLGDLESGAVSALAGPRFSVVSGGLACVAGVALLAWRLPEFVRYRAPLGDDTSPAPTGSRRTDVPGGTDGERSAKSGEVGGLPLERGTEAGEQLHQL